MVYGISLTLTVCIIFKAFATKIMAVIGYPELIIVVICLLFLHRLNRKNLPTNWPLFGMLPALLVNLHRIQDWVTFISSKNACTFVFKGPWFTNMSHIVVTSDPADMRYIFNINFSNYPKGDEFREFFDVLGDGIFNADSDSWRTQRKAAHHLINHKKFQIFLDQAIHNKVQYGLIPVLDHVLEHNLVVDLQDLFKRYAFDTTLIFVSGIDFQSLSIKFSKFPFVDAFDDLEEAIFYRHALPMSLWKIQRYLGVGKEKKLKEAWRNLDQFVGECISRKREMLGNEGENKEREENGVDLLTSYMEEDEFNESKTNQFLRDTIVNFMIAGRSTLSAALTWFFWLVSKNSEVELKIIEELKSLCKGEKMKMFGAEELKGLVYLQGALTETLRLYPSVPFEHKRPVTPDILPSGHAVDSKTKILPFLYSMGRMEEVWGKDCLEFKPERWISKEGRIEYVPSYKFMAFNSGPRTCIGKEIAFTQMRMVAANLLFNYHVQVVDTHPVSIKNSVILYMDGGLRVKIKRRL